MNNLKYLSIEQLEKLLNEYLVENIMIYNSNDRSPFFDYLVVCDCSNEKIVHSIANKLINYCKDNNISIKLTELKNPRWIIIDFYNIIFHIFEEQERKYFDLDSLWTMDEVIEINENDIETNNNGKEILIQEEDLAFQKDK